MISDVRGKYPVYYFTYDRTYYWKEGTRNVKDDPFDTTEEVQEFVNAATKCDFDIDICYNRYVIDAKSFLGVYGLDFTKPLTVSYDGYNDKFEEMLKQCAIAC